MAVVWKKIAFEDEVILKTLLTTRGDIIYRNATVPARLAKGASGKVLTMGANDPAWSDPTGGAPNAHKDSHDPEDGSDPVDTAAPVQVGSANAIGNSHSLARANHVHQREHAKYLDSAAKAAAVQSGTITNGVTKAPTHDAVFDVKATADAAQTAAEVDADILTHKNISTAHHTKYTNANAVTAVKAGVKLNELQNPTGSVEFNQQQALQLVIENRTSDPGSPVTGQIWLRTDLD